MFQIATNSHFLTVLLPAPAMRLGDSGSQVRGAAVEVGGGCLFLGR